MTTPSRFTPDQLTAITARDHLLIEAGAGSGKTTTLVEKILYELGAEVTGRRVAHPCALDQIVAITFTNAAAADLKRKLRARLRREASDSGDPKWTRLIYDVDRALIGTIHGFCAGILREYALRIDLDPYFVVLEEHESTSIRGECARAAVMQALAQMDDRAIQLVATIGLERAITLVSRAASDAPRALATLEAWDCEERQDERTLAAHVAAMSARWGIADDVELDARTEVRAAAAGVWILRMAREACARMRERCDASSSMDFDMLIARAREALAEPSVAAVVRGRLRWVCIDEFQDTDPVQLEIGYQLCGLLDGKPLEDAPRLCLIGDPKQSIYRFRHADVSVWRDVVDRFASIGIAPVRLARNFRSRAPIMGLVNATFDGLIGNGPAAVTDAGHEVEFTPLDAHREAPGDDEIVEIVRIPADGKTAAQRATEAAWIVARVQAMLDEAIVWDDEAPTPAWRKPRWSDFALLARGRTEIGIYEDAFRAAGIPFVINGGSGFFRSRVVRDIALLLGALIDPADNLSWLGLLRSPFVTLRDETMLRFAMEHRDAPLSGVLDQEAPPLEAACIERARAWIATLRVMCDRSSVATLIRHAVDSSGYAAQAMFRDDGDATLANLQKLARIADAEPRWSVAEFLARLHERADQSRKESEAPLYTAGEEVVTITTVHGAKGLEWPIVFLYDLRRDIDGTKSESLYFDPAVGVATSVLGDSAHHSVMLHRERALSRAEEKRLWYVAATRARDCLVLCVPDASAADAPTAQEEAGYVHEWLCRAIDPVEHIYKYGERTWRVRDGGVAAGVIAEDTPAVRELPSLGSLGGAEALAEDAARMVRAVPHAFRLPRRSATELMQLHEDASVHRDRYVDGLPDRRLFRRDEHGNAPAGVPARIMGDILHASLEEQIAEAELDAFHERELSERLGEPVTSPRVREARRRLRALALAARSNPAVAKLYDAPGSERELAFTWFRHPQGGDAALIHGAMDLVGRVGDELEIVDYKSHTLAPGEEAAAAAKYALQRDLYAEALGAVLGTAPARFTFYFPETDCPVVSKLDAAGRAGRLAQIDQLLLLAHAGTGVANSI